MRGLLRVYRELIITRISALWNGGDIMPSKSRKRKPKDKKQRREVLRTVYYLASLVSVLIRLVCFFWDRFNQ